MIHETNDQNICKDLIGIDTIEKLGSFDINCSSSEGDLNVSFT